MIRCWRFGGYFLTFSTAWSALFRGRFPWYASGDRGGYPWWRAELLGVCLHVSREYRPLHEVLRRLGT